MTVYPRHRAVKIARAEIKVSLRDVTIGRADVPPAQSPKWRASRPARRW